MGLVYEELKDTPNAVEAYKDAIKFDPKLAAPMNHLGNVYFSANDIKKAPEMALKIDFDNKEILKNDRTALGEKSS